MRPLLLAALLVLPLTSPAQLVRQAANLNLPADLPVTTGYSTENALGSLTFSQPMLTVVPPGETNRLFVVERGGNIQVVTTFNPAPTKGLAAYFSVPSLLTGALPSGQTFRSDGENGFLSMVFHPDFATNGTFFVYFSMQTSDGKLFQRLHQITVNVPAANFGATTTSPVVLHSHKPLLTILDRDTNHNGGDLHFGADGFLYLSTGDEGGGGDNRNNARFINHRNDGSVQRTGFWGQMLRLAVELDTKTQPGVFPAGTVLPNTHTQNSTAFPSALLNPSITVPNYRVPGDNPFIGYTLWHSAAIAPLTVRTEIYATGLRNPYRWSFDPPTGRLFLGDVGQSAREEIDLVQKGDDLGWSWREGAIAYTSSPGYPESTNSNTAPAPPPGGAPPGTGFSPKAPIYDYDRSNDGTVNDSVVYGSTVTGGMVYRGNRLTELYGAYIFAEYGNGFIVALREQTNGTWTGTRLATDNGIVDFGTDPRNGDVIFCDLGSGTVKRLTRSGTTGTAPPGTLSATLAFSSLTTLTPSTGLVAYAPNVDFWSDYALKSRWFAIENPADTVGFSANGNWTLPTGMVWIKHFEIETTRGVPATRRKLETRILVKTATDIYGLSYRWNNLQSGTQTDATLVPEEGENQSLNITVGSTPTTQTWRFPSRTECRVCHTAVGGFALSFNTRQMNKEHPYGAGMLNQIAALRDAQTPGGLPASYFTGGTAPSVTHTLPAFSADPATSLEWRVRSYLAVNCVQCHQPGGTATGNWDARATTPTDMAALINGLLVNNDGDILNKWCVPDDLGHSMVLKRLQGAGVPRMPPLGTNERDLAAEDLLTQWIDSNTDPTALPARKTFAQWQTTHFGSTSHPDAQPGQNPDGDGQINELDWLLGESPLAIDPPYLPLAGSVGGQFTLSFEHPANRSVLIETTTDFQAWSLWNVPGNAPLFPATPQIRVLTGPLDVPNRFFRLRLSTP